MRVLRFDIIATIVEKIAKAFFDTLLELCTTYKGVKTCEMRLDALEPKELSLVLRTLHEMISMQTILTFRPKEQGGLRELTLQERWNFWINLPEKLKHLIINPESKVFVDFELDLIEWIKEKGYDMPFPYKKIGVSFHDLTGKYRLSDFLDILERMRATHVSAFFKVIGKALKEEQNPDIFYLIQNCKDQIPFVTFLMEEAGRETRKNSLVWGACGGAYGFIPGREKGGPGQFSIQELLEDSSIRSLFKIK